VAEERVSRERERERVVVESLAASSLESGSCVFISSVSLRLWSNVECFLDRLRRGGTFCMRSAVFYCCVCFLRDVACTDPPQSGMDCFDSQIDGKKTFHVTYVLRPQSLFFCA
jgi:hypothetical protein